MDLDEGSPRSTASIPEFRFLLAPFPDFPFLENYFSRLNSSPLPSQKVNRTGTLETEVES